MGCPPRNRLFYRPLLDDVHQVVTDWEHNLTRWRRREIVLSLAMIGAVVAGCGAVVWMSVHLEKPPYSPRFANSPAALVSTLESRGAIMGRDPSGRINRAVVQSPSFNDTDLALLAQLPDLQTVLLVDASVTDAGVMLLSRVPKLQVVQLIDTQVTDEGGQKLQAALPRSIVKVRRSTGQ